MRVLVVAPGHAFSTIDVFDGLVYGLRSHGVDTKTFPLHETLEIVAVMIEHTKRANALPAYPSPHDMACAGIPGLCMAYGITHCIVVNGENVPPSIPATLRRGGIVTALLCTESPYQTTTRERYMSRLYDVTFTNERAALPLFTETPAARVFYLPHAYHPERHTRDGAQGEAADVFFCGTRFPERAALLDGVDWSGIAFHDRTVWLSDGEDPLITLSRTMPNTEVAAHYRSARISLNHHRTTGDLRAQTQISDPVQSLGPRAYEIPACGGFMLCDDSRAELRDVFGDTVPTYDAGDPASLERQIRHYLTHPDQRDALRDAQYEAVRPHHWRARAASILDILTSVTSGRLLPGAALPNAA